MTASSNQEIINEIKRLEELHQQYFKENDFPKANEIGKRIRELKPQADYGYRVGDLIEYRVKKKWMKGQIKDISDNWQINLGFIELPVNMIRPIESKEEQTDIFDFI